MIPPHVWLVQRIREARLVRAFSDIADPKERRLARAIASLPDRQHEVFRLARFVGLKPAAIAARMGISERRATGELALALFLIGRSVRRQQRRQRRRHGRDQGRR